MYQLMTDFLFSVAEYSVADMTINNRNLIKPFWHSCEIFAQCLEFLLSNKVNFVYENEIKCIGIELKPKN